MSAPFHFPPRRGDALLALAGTVEKAVRGATRRLRSGVPIIERIELGRAFSPFTDSSAKEGEAPLIMLPAVAWSYRFQRPQQLSRALAELGHSILYVESFDRHHLQPRRRLMARAPGIWSLALPLSGRPDPYRTRLSPAAAESAANTIAAGLTATPEAIVVQLPFWGPLGLALRKRLGCPLLYDRIDLHSGFPGVTAEIDLAEQELLIAADLVTASSTDLRDRSSGAREPTVLLPNAVAEGDFSVAEIPPGPPLRVGYVGAIAGWFDHQAVILAARQEPLWNFVLAGRLEDRTALELRAEPNVSLLGEVPYREVPGILASLHAALIPFRDTPLTRAVDPVKLYEALATGVPVVARDLPETQRWNEPEVYLYRQPQDLAGQLRRAVDNDSPARRWRRREAVSRHTWKARATALLDLLKRPNIGGPTASAGRWEQSPKRPGELHLPAEKVYTAKKSFGEA